MNLAQPQIGIAALLTVSIINVSTAMLAPRAAGDTDLMSRTAAQSTAGRDDLSWVEKRVREWQPTPEERALDNIGWARDIREAQRLAREDGRPVFLFTHDGRMGIGRC